MFPCRRTLAIVIRARIETELTKLSQLSEAAFVIDTRAVYKCLLAYLLTKYKHTARTVAYPRLEK